MKILFLCIVEGNMFGRNNVRSLAISLTVLINLVTATSLRPGPTVRLIAIFSLK
jgi:hypothetical protein